ncbi:hypothetical protein A5719_20715 [Mycolicibacterium peregrinum]|nr:hypothetical protein A5719_20715 [Mycolicibacterium peregrinum]
MEIFGGENLPDAVTQPTRTAYRGLMTSSMMASRSRSLQVAPAVAEGLGDADCVRHEGDAGHFGDDDDRRAVAERSCGS